MRVPKGEKISFRADGQLLVFDINEEFTIDTDNLEHLPRNYAYLKELETRTLENLRKLELKKDKFYSVQFLIMKEEVVKDRPPSDKWVHNEIMEDEEYLGLLEGYNAAYINYKKVAGIVRSYQAFIDITRTIVASMRTDFKNS